MTKSDSPDATADEAATRETVDAPVAGMGTERLRNAAAAGSGIEKDVAFERARAAMLEVPQVGLARENATRLGNYYVLDKLGAGAMGVVFAAYDPDLDRKVAIKVLKNRSLGDALGTKRLHREARALARLNHPNVVTVHGVGEHEGRAWVAMEFVEGRDLRQWLDDAGDGDEPRPWSEVLSAFLDAARGLAAAHEADVVHRDFKPANVLVGNDGIVRVADFGLARPATDQAVGAVTQASDSHSDADSWRGEQRLTGTRGVVGTPAYMAPEQYIGSEVGPAADQYAFAASLFEGLYGQLPFDANGLLALVEAKSSGTLAALPGETRVPKWLHKIVVRGLAPKPGDRFPSMQSLIDAVEQGRKEAQRRPRWPLWLGVAAMAVAGAALTTTLTRGPAAQEAVDPCEGVAKPIREAWDDRREQVHEAMVATGLEYADDVWAFVSGELDGHSAAWIDVSTRVCRQSHSGQIRPEVAELQGECLERSRADVESATDLFLEADPGILASAGLLLGERLVEPAECLEDNALTRQVIRSRDARTRREGNILFSRASHLYRLRLAGKREEAKALTAELEAAITPELEPHIRGELQRAVAGGLPPGDPNKERLMRASLEDHIRARADRDAMLAAHDLGATYMARGEPAKAVPALGIGLALSDRIDSLEARTETKDHQANVTMARPKLVNLLGRALTETGRRDEGMEHLREAAVLCEDLGGRFTWIKVEIFNNYAEALRETGDHGGAFEYYDKAIAVGSEVMGERHPSVGTILNNRGAAYLDVGDFDRARTDLERGREIMAKKRGENHPDLALLDYNIALLEISTGQLDAASERLERAVETWKTKLPAGHPYVAVGRMSLGTIARQRNELDRALELGKAACDQLAAAFKPNPHFLTATADAEYALTLVAAGRNKEAAEPAEKAVTGFEKSVGLETPSAFIALYARGEVARSTGRPSDAIAAYEQAITLLTEHGSKTHPELAWPLVAAAEVDVGEGRDPKAAERLASAKALRDEAAIPAELRERMRALEQSLGG